MTTTKKIRLHILHTVALVTAGLFICSGVKAGDDTFRVFPYVQNITETSAVVRWETLATQVCTLTLKALKVDTGATAVIKIKPGKIGVAKISHLMPNTNYAYKLSLGTLRYAIRGTLRTSPTFGSAFRFVAYGDSRSRPDSHTRVLEGIQHQQDVKLILHTGDLVGSGITTDSLQREFFEPGQRVFDHIPLYPCLGNHDGGSTGMRDNFSLPGSGGWYSFKCSDILFVILNSNLRFGKGSTQYQWLVNTLALRKGYRIIIMLHHPPYSSGPHSSLDAEGHPNETGIRDGREVIPVLSKLYPIKLVISGHDHSYERSQKDGVTYIVAGGGGAPLYGKSNPQSNHFSQVFNSVLHYCIFDVTKHSIMMTTLTPDGKIIDKCSIQ